MKTNSTGSNSAFSTWIATSSAKTGRPGSSATPAPTMTRPLNSPTKIGARRKSRLTPLRKPNASATE